MSSVRALLSRAAPAVTRRIAQRWGDTLPLYLVCEYPKSGGTWLAKMLADYLQIPLPQRALLPVAMTAVVHNHWAYDPRLRRVIHVTRDGRDVMTSLYFHRLRVMRDPSHVGARRVADRLRAVFGAGWDLDDVRGNMARFIAAEFARPLGCPQAWARYVDGWAAAAPERVVQTRYETLLDDPQGALGALVRAVSGAEPVPWRVAATVEKFSFERVTGRARGSEDRTSFARRGVAGDWRNHLSREAAMVFDRLAGDTLIRLGYELDHRWVDTVAD